MKAAVAFVVQRPDAVAFGPSPIDPAFARGLQEALGTILIEARAEEHRSQVGHKLLSRMV
jgi:DNA-binding sugar fermentation-stimulating protein